VEEKRGFPSFQRSIYAKKKTQCIDACGPGYAISDGVVWFQRVPAFQRHQLPSTGSRSVAEGWWKMVVFAVISVADMEQCFDARGDGEYYLRSACTASEGAGVLGALIAVVRKSMGHTVGERSWWKNVVSPVFYRGCNGKVLLRLWSWGLPFPVGLFRVRECWCFMVIDCRRPEVEGTYAG
jgi:hypothetical protein